jgi:hypothetical protein
MVDVYESNNLLSDEKYRIVKKYTDAGFCIFSFPYIKTYIDPVSGIERKDPKFNVKWHSINNSNNLLYINMEHTGFAFVAGEYSRVTVIDIDSVDEYNRMVTDFPELKKYVTIKTRKGFHIYCEYTPDIQTRTDSMVNYAKVDIRNDMSLAFCPPCEYTTLDGTVVKYELLDNDGSILEFPPRLKLCLRQFHEVQTDEFIIYSG